MRREPSRTGSAWGQLRARRRLLRWARPIAPWVTVAAVLFHASSLHAQRRYYVDDLGTLGGYDNRALGVSEQGGIAGWSSCVEAGRPRAVLYAPGGPVNLGTLGGYDESYAQAINDDGRIVGYCCLSTSKRAAMHFGGSWTNLGSLGGTVSFAYDINNAGLVVGASTSSTLSASTYGFLITPVDTNQDSVPDLWYRDQDQDGANDLMLKLGTFGGTSSLAQGLNAQGQVVGWAKAASRTYAFLYSQSVMVNLGTLNPDVSSYATAINGSGAVVGYLEAMADDMTVYRGFSFRDLNGNLQADSGELTLLETLSDWSHLPYAVNDAGDAVGTVEANLFVMHAGLWSGGHVWDLNNLIPQGSGCVLEEARDINNAGRIVGSGLCEADSSYHAYRLTPATGGDANGDRAVNVGDLGVLAGHWGQGGQTWSEGDFTGDGLVNIGDLGVLAGHWGWTGAPPGSPPAVPEPTGLAILALGAAAIPRPRRR